jgi:hypothetical protein
MSDRTELPLLFSQPMVQLQRKLNRAILRISSLSTSTKFTESKS